MEHTHAGPERRGTAVWWCGAIVGLVVAAAAFAWFDRGGPPATPGIAAIGDADAAARGARRETRPTLDPARFVGKAAVTHRIAREIPEVLDRLYCYCECDKSIGHKSLLSCYTDGHAAT
jgi:hypothetical protein